MGVRRGRPGPLEPRGEEFPVAGKDERVVRVEVFGQQYAIRSELDPKYVQELAAYVTAKMRAAADSTPSSDVLRVAILAALNLADEVFRCADGERLRTAALTEKAAAIEQLVDQALG